MVIARAANQVVRGADAAVPVSSTRGSVKYAVEAIGAFFLLVSISAAVGSASPFAPLGIGAVLMMVVYPGDHLSGAHHNAVVTLAVLVGRRIALRDAITYWIVQFGVESSIPRRSRGARQ
jgi:aquaporin Z